MPQGITEIVAVCLFQLWRDSHRFQNTHFIRILFFFFKESKMAGRRFQEGELKKLMN